MRRVLLPSLLLALFSSLLWAKGDRQYLKVYDFYKGVDTYHGSTSLPDGFVQNALNVSFDAIAPVTKRQGYTVAWSTKSYSYTGLWTYTDSSNTTWQLVRSSDQITASNLAGTVVKVSTVSANNLVSETNAFGNAYFVDQTQGVYYWNGTATTAVAGSPTGSIITTFHNRVWVTGAAVPNGNQLYGSKYGDGTVWTTGLNATDPVQVSVGLNDNFDSVSAEYVYLDTLYVFKHASIYALYGFDQTNFQISFLTQECGCIDGNTIQTFNGSLKFVSLRGVEDFNGYTCKRISDPIKNKTDPSTLNNFSAQSWVQQTASDWNAGTFTPSNSLNTSIASPSLVPSTFSITENTNTKWNAGFNNRLQVNASSITSAISAPVNVSNNSFESGLAGWNTSCSGTCPCGTGGWIQSTGGIGGPNPPYCTGISATQGSFFATTCDNNNGLFGVTMSLTAQLIDINSAVLTSYSVPISVGMHTFTFNMANFVGVRGAVRFQATSSQDTGVRYLNVSPYYIIGGNVTFDAGISCNGSNDFVGVDNVLGSSSTANDGSFTSQIYNSGASSMSYQMLYSYVANTSTPSFDLQTASNNLTGPWTELLTSSSTNAIGNQYVKYTTTVTASGNDSALSAVTSVGILGTASPATLISQSHNITGIGSFGNLSINQFLNNGTIVYDVCTAAASNMSAKTCKTVTANSQIMTPTNNFVQIVATFTVTAATQTPTLQSTAINWYSGTRSPPMASTVWDNRYWLSLSTTTADTFNDEVAVLNTRGAWALYDLHAGGFTQTKNNLYHADSLASGNIYLDNQGYADNGAAINAFVQTKDYAFGDLPADEYMYVFYPALDSLGNCAVSFQYMPDKSGTNYSLGSPLQSEFATMSSVRLPFPVDSSHQDFGQTMNFTVSTNDSQCPFQFYGFEGIFKERQPQ